MDLTSDEHSMQLNHKHVPNLVVSARRSGVFRLPLGHRIVYVYNFIKFLIRQLTPGIFDQLPQAPRQRKAPPYPYRWRQVCHLSGASGRDGCSHTAGQAD